MPILPAPFEKLRRSLVRVARARHLAIDLAERHGSCAIDLLRADIDRTQNTEHRRLLAEALEVLLICPGLDMMPDPAAA